MTDSPLTIRNCVFSFKCDAQWEDLEEISSNDYVDPDKVRFCSACQREVFFSETDEDLAHNVRLNRCVAIYRSGVVEFKTIGLVAP
jgi:hypothetical protein